MLLISYLERLKPTGSEIPVSLLRVGFWTQGCLHPQCRGYNCMCHSQHPSNRTRYCWSAVRGKKTKQTTPKIQTLSEVHLWRAKIKYFESKRKKVDTLLVIQRGYPIKGTVWQPPTHNWLKYYSESTGNQGGFGIEWFKGFKKKKKEERGKRQSETQN